MDVVQSLIARHFSVDSGELCISNVPVSRLAAEYGTPFFAYSSAVIKANVAMLRDALPPGFSLYYSLKANPNPAVIEYLLGIVDGLEIASSGEFDRAIEAGCAPEHILFAGPGKTPAELEHVISRGIGEIHVESLREAQRVSEISAASARSTHVAIRVNPTGDAEGGAMRMGGRPAPFGIDEELLEDTVTAMLALPSIKVVGVHLFTGTQILDFEILLSQYRKGFEIARRVAALTGPLRTLDFGGGLGVPYFPHESPLDLVSLRNGLSDVMQSMRQDALFASTTCVVEPGRFLVGEAGIYVARVVDIKTSRGKKFLILDGGMNHHLAASGNLGQTIKRNFPVTVANRLAEERQETVDVVGPLCTPLDILGRNINLPCAREGDLIAVFQSGAYARSASPLGFLSHPAPPEVWVEKDGKHSLAESNSYKSYAIGG